jgi:hypothetical protein
MCAVQQPLPEATSHSTRRRTAVRRADHSTAPGTLSRRRPATKPPAAGTLSCGQLLGTPGRTGHDHGDRLLPGLRLGFAGQEDVLAAPRTAAHIVCERVLATAIANYVDHRWEPPVIGVHPTYGGDGRAVRELCHGRPTRPSWGPISERRAQPLASSRMERVEDLPAGT